MVTGREVVFQKAEDPILAREREAWGIRRGDDAPYLEATDAASHAGLPGAPAGSGSPLLG